MDSDSPPPPTSLPPTSYDPQLTLQADSRLQAASKQRVHLFRRRKPRIKPSASNLSLSSVPNAAPPQPGPFIEVDPAIDREIHEDQDVYRWAVLYENERGIKLFSTPYYSSVSLLPTIDPSPFTVPSATSSKSATQPDISLRTFPLPDGSWKWIGPWLVDMRSEAGEVQFDGWEYNTWYRTHNWNPEAGPFSWVRRRRWLRLMCRPRKKDTNATESPNPSTPGPNNVRHSMASSLPPSVSASDNDAAVEEVLQLIWTTDHVEENWELYRSAIKCSGTDGRLLEFWARWLGDHQPRDRRGKRRQWTEDEEVPFLDIPDPPSVPTPSLPPAPPGNILPTLRAHGENIMQSFVFPESRKVLLEMISRTELKEALDGLSGVEFWSLRVRTLSPSTTFLEWMPPSTTTASFVELLERLAALVPKNAAHPLQVSARTYVLGLVLSLGPALVPILIAFSKKKSLLKRVLYRELSVTGFAFGAATCVGGGSFLREAWTALDERFPNNRSSRLTAPQKTFLSNVVSCCAGLMLLQAGRHRSLDLTLLLLVRALDAGVQSFVAHRSGSRRESDAKPPDHLREQHFAASAKRAAMRMQIDAFLFWACSARIMWCFFYAPERLPKSYVKWINTLAGVDARLLEALRGLRTGEWSYRKGVSHKPDLLTSYARDLGYPVAWGDPAKLPAYGGQVANDAWNQLGIKNRRNLGGIPCEMVHGQVGSSIGLEDSCVANASLRGSRAFLEALAIYVPVQFLPILLTRPLTLLDPRRIAKSLVGAFRSAMFLSTFLSSFWFSVCLTRTLAAAPLLPSVSHDFWDSDMGCILAGCLVCGSSIWIENGRRRGEMALYVLPRAVRACLPSAWVRRQTKSSRLAERLTFILSLASLLTAANHYPHVLRGLSRWGLRFIVRGPDIALSWRSRKVEEDTRPPAESP
ncbi:hypothetical protein MKEN_00818600 [Mycena kentingensis (nom. inval.)]|nr:hypothetical protein MKEN_00818600 [Mycena kentingensis (nom. inval.)]